MGSFLTSINANIEKIKIDVNAKCYAITTELLSEIVYKTPVLDGHLKNNWFAKVGKDFSSAINPFPDASGSGSMMSISSILQSEAFLGVDGVVTMTNNLPYAYKIEYLGHSKNKAPYGMVRVSLTSVAAKYK